LRSELLHAGDASRMKLQGLRADRIPVLPGAVAIMSAIFKEFGLERMTFSEGALRLGVLYDQLGRYHHADLREATVNLFMQRYEVDRRQAARVAQTALALLKQMDPASLEAEHSDAQFLVWAARLHEIGISVAHSSYHKHSAYIIANADMPGFSRRNQARLSRLVLAHRGKLERAQTVRGEAPEWPLILCLRVAVLLHRSRDDQALPPLSAAVTRNGFQLTLGACGLDALPLTTATLEDEAQQWAGIGRELLILRDA
jgi:exopolyphosphatase/guanosine-5'-triphosphate,3'-diphosphate pyrophosphatase